MKTGILGIGILMVPLLGGSLEAQVLKLSPGDSVVISVENQPRLSGRFRVNDFGDLLVPQGGVIHAAGMTLEVLTNRIRDGYRPYFGSLKVDVTTPALELAEQQTEEEQGQGDPIPSEVAVLPEDSLQEAKTILDGSAVADTSVSAGPEIPTAPPTPVSDVDSTVTVVTASGQDLHPPTSPQIPDTIAVISPPSETAPPEPDSARVIPDMIRAEAAEVRGNAVPEPQRGEPNAPNRTDYPPPPLNTEVPRTGSGSAIGFSLSAVGGVASTKKPFHGYGGLMAMASWRRIGVMALGEYGDGGGYSSLLLTGGLTYEIYRAGPISLIGTAGYSYYSEEGFEGLSRSLPAAMGGAILSIQLGPVRPSVALNGFLGSFEGDDGSEAFNVNFLRVSFGLGF